MWPAVRNRDAQPARADVGGRESALRTNQYEWEDLAALDPLWSILSEPSKQFSRWQLEEFFATGEREIADLLQHARAQGHAARSDSRVLDFGCGVGRLTRALAARFSEAVGVDISDRMIDRARVLNADIPNCHFVINVSQTLSIFPDNHFELVYSSIVLQHVPQREAILSYIAEFVRVLRPGGLLVFQVPTFLPYRNRVQLRRRIYATLRALPVTPAFLYDALKLSPMRMNFVHERDVAAVLAARGGTVISVQRGDRGVKGLRSCTYFVSKATCT